jgi:XRE family transcriptional regulator, aerobic/anaerobic benzoate catabolism transcriptional regulator
MRHPTPVAADPASPLLASLGERVRRLRRERGWSRTDLAERSGLSVRFLARVEAGDGNISLRRLEDLARALELPPDALLQSDGGRTRIVVLVGMRGAGKSTVGPLLARALGVPFLEMDEAIESLAGLPLDQIFELHGERYYRRLEREAAARLLAERRPAVLAAAGGVVHEASTWDLLRERATVVWLKALPEDHWNRVIAQGDRRPMADNPDALAELRAMLAARAPLYGRSHLAVETSGRSPEEVVLHLRERLEAAGRAPAP